MRTGVFLFGGVEMDDAGPGPPASTDRRSTSEEAWEATERVIDMAVVCDDLGYDSYWLAEHHFQHEGYEVVPNGILLGAVIAERTQRIRIGMAFNIVLSGIRSAWPRTSPLCITSPEVGGSSASGGAPSHGSPRRWVPESGVLTTLIRRPPTSPTAGSSTRPWT